MKPLFEDTAPEVERLLIERYRHMTPSERLREMQQMNDFARSLVEADVRRRFPSASKSEQQKEVLKRYLPADVLEKVWTARIARGIS